MSTRVFSIVVVLALLVGLRGASAQNPEVRDNAWAEALQCMRTHDYETAERAFTTAIENGKSSWKAWLLRGYARYRLAHRGALSDFEEAAYRHPTSAYAFAAQAVTLEFNDQFNMDSRRRAVSLMDRAVERAPDQAIYYALRGSFQVAANRFKEGMADLDHAVSLAPDDASILRLRYRALVDWGNHDAEAERDRKALLRLDPDGKAKDATLPAPRIPES
jgi:tetratricopeptide (TPR) repeat protein